MARNYKRENRYKKKPEQIRKRVIRNAARRKALKEGRVKKGDGKHVHHTDWTKKKGGRTKVVSASKNSSFKRTKSAGKKNPKA